LTKQFSYESAARGGVRGALGWAQSSFSTGEDPVTQRFTTLIGMMDAMKKFNLPFSSLTDLKNRASLQQNVGFGRT
jgi:hypothetical protein